MRIFIIFHDCGHGSYFKSHWANDTLGFIAGVLSSFYKLPKILQWFSGNIGFHHIHHLSPRVPNYNLQRCHEAEPLFRQVQPMTLFSSLKSLTLRLWDEKAKRLVGYRRMRQLRNQHRAELAARQQPRNRS
jgi:fatty acid desaturase